ncbi:MAG: DUF6232 family protein [bacterium]
MCPEAPETEVLYSDDAGVTVTRERAEFPQASFAVSDITGAALSSTRPVQPAPMLLIIAGFLVILGAVIFHGRQFTFLGLVVLMAGIALQLAARTRYSLRVTTASGSVEVMAGMERETADKLFRALKRARYRT